MEIVLIAAVAANGVIGDDGTMPWHYPTDLRRFKQLTMGHPVIMGRRTYESIAERLGGPLPGRTNIVLSRGDPAVDPTVIVAGSIDEALTAADQTGASAVFVIGGATVYEQLLDDADRLELTEIDRSVDGDTRFPDWDRSDWVEHRRMDHDELSFVTYVRAT